AGRSWWTDRRSWNPGAIGGIRRGVVMHDPPAVRALFEHHAEDPAARLGGVGEAPPPEDHRRARPHAGDVEQIEAQLAHAGAITAVALLISREGLVPAAADLATRGEGQSRRARVAL